MCSAAMRRSSQSERKLSEMLNLEQGEICIGASDMTLKYFLLPYLEEFHERYPGIRVTVTNAPTRRRSAISATAALILAS